MKFLISKACLGLLLLTLTNIAMSAQGAGFDVVASVPNSSSTLQLCPPGPRPPPR